MPSRIHKPFLLVISRLQISDKIINHYCFKPLSSIFQQQVTRIIEARKIIVFKLSARCAHKIIELNLKDVLNPHISVKSQHCLWESVRLPSFSWIVHHLPRWCVCSFFFLNVRYMILLSSLKYQTLSRQQKFWLGLKFEKVELTILNLLWVLWFCKTGIVTKSPPNPTPTIFSYKSFYFKELPSLYDIDNTFVNDPLAYLRQGQTQIFKILTLFLIND